ncbi:MAG: GNAT family N-acyltransferase [Bacteroidota bacterium]
MVSFGGKRSTDDIIKVENEQINKLQNDWGIKLQLHHKDLRRIPRKEAFIAIVHRQSNEVDELVLLHAFAKITPLPEIIVAGTYSKFNVRLRELYEKTRRGEASTLTSLLKLDNEPSIEKAIREGRSLVIVLEHPSESPWNLPRRQRLKSLFKTIKRLNAPILPLHLQYEWPIPQSQRLRPLTPGQEASHKAILRIGNAISTEDQQAFDKTSRFRRFIQSRIFALGSALEVKKFYFNPKSEKNQQLPIIDPITVELLEQDIQQLTFQNLLSSQSNYDVFVARTQDIPNVIKEIGRLREETFRSVDEGTGMSLDLDEYDLYYEQLFIWDREAKKIVGGYRLGRGHEIFHHYGVEGFYIHSLFKIDQGLYPIMQQSIELGRSFVAQEYQRKRLPLYLLWRGILFFLLQNTNYNYLYGPLSISKHYSDISKSLIIEFVKRNYFDHDLARYLKPRKPFETKEDSIDIELIMDTFQGELDKLDNFIEEIEPSYFRIPVLLKQYIRQNAKFISFNVDPNFSDVLDGFMILNIKDIPYTTIQALKKEAR